VNPRALVTSAGQTLTLLAMDRERWSRRTRDDDGHHRSRERDDDRHRRRSHHDTDAHRRHDGGDEDRRELRRNFGERLDTGVQDASSVSREYRITG